MANHLSQGIDQSKNAQLAWPTDTNEVFCIISKALAEKLKQQEATFHPWNPPRSQQNLISDDKLLIRLVTSFATSTDQVDQFIDLLG